LPEDPDDQARPSGGAARHLVAAQLLVVIGVVDQAILQRRALRAGGTDVVAVQITVPGCLQRGRIVYVAAVAAGGKRREGAAGDGGQQPPSSCTRITQRHFPADHG